MSAVQCDHRPLLGFSLDLGFFLTSPGYLGLSYRNLGFFHLTVLRCLKIENDLNHDDKRLEFAVVARLTTTGPPAMVATTAVTAPPPVAPV